MAYEHLIPTEQYPLARALWEQIFTDDSADFLDMFDALKSSRTILGMLCDRKMAAMLQLDHCRIMFGRDHIISADYIVGVSTLPSFRKKGLMRELLTEALRESAAKHEPFIFLMPAQKEIYLPFGFREIYTQTTWCTPSSPAARACEFNTFLKSAAPSPDTGKLATISSKILSETSDVYMIRDQRYFEDLIIEMASEDGHVAELSAEPGYICWWPALGDTPSQIREIVSIDPEKTAKALGLVPAESRPIIMARVTDPAEFIKPLRANEPIELFIDYTDDILSQFAGLWKLSVGVDGAEMKRLSSTKKPSPGPANVSAANSPVALSAERLTEWLFGASDIQELDGIIRPSRILLNEWI